MPGDPQPNTFSEAPKGVVTSARHTAGGVFIALLVWTTAMSSDKVHLGKQDEQPLASG